MTPADRHAKVCELIASGALTSDPPVIHRAGEKLTGPCLVCSGLQPSVAYFWPGGVVVRLHASCDALWKEERDLEA